MRLERIPDAHLHDAGFTLNLRKVIEVTGRGQSQQCRIRRHSTVGKTGQMLRVCDIENVPAKLQNVVVAVRHLPRLPESQVDIDKAGVAEVVPRAGFTRIGIPEVLVDLSNVTAPKKI